MKRITNILKLIFILATFNISNVNAYNILGEVWPNNYVLMLADIPGVSDSGISWNQAFSEAASLWSDNTNINIGVRRIESHACAGYILGLPENNFQNGIAFYHDACGESFGSGVLAVTISRFENDQLIEADIVFNNNELWDIYSGALGIIMDFRRVAAHELGHVIGLGHEDVKPSLMNSLLSDIETPTIDDLAGVAMLYGDPNAQILMTLEEPANNMPVNGISNIRGWALATYGIEQVELYIDNTLAATIPYGGSRHDVGIAFPQFDNANDSGFSMAISWGLLSSGSHKITVRVYDLLGDFEEQTSIISVASFATPFIQNANQIQLGNDISIINNTSILIRDMLVDGNIYDTTMQWQVTSQKFEVINITPK